MKEWSLIAVIDKRNVPISKLFQKNAILEISLILCTIHRTSNLRIIISSKTAYCTPKFCNNSEFHTKLMCQWLGCFPCMWLTWELPLASHIVPQSTARNYPYAPSSVPPKQIKMVIVIEVNAYLYQSYLWKTSVP